MNTQIIAIANQKGGVGKTTTCANLGIGLAQAGKKVLLIDGDPQGSLTISLGNPQPDKLPFTLSDAMGHILMDEPIHSGEGILHHPEGVDLMPADIQLSGMEVSLVNAMSRETILRQYLDTLKGQYSKEGVDAIGAALRELEAAGYIVRHKLRDSQGRISDTEYVIYEQPQLRKPDTDSPDTENPYMDKPDTEKPAELNIEKSNTQKQNIYGSSTDSIPFRDCAADCLPERKGRDAMSLTEIESYRELIQENIGYEYLCQQYETYREDLDEIVELIVETVCAKRKTTRIAGSDFPHEIVRSRFLKLDNSHIEFVMDCLQKNTTEIRNMKQYLLTVLFNAPTTISNHYTSQVNHDLYGGW